LKTVLGASLLLALVSCTKNKMESKPLDLASKGRTVYMSACIACHNGDPKQEGVLGPAVYGSSKELLAARILTATYPEGYKPKRPSKTMVALPHLKDDIDAIHAYLNAP
jgi:mono/diheme cytochrome c family protein